MNAQIPVHLDCFPPMPTVLVGTELDGKANFLTIGWCMRVNREPPMLAVGLNNKRYSNQGILRHKTFSVCLPDCSMTEVTDYCGIVSGADVDKSALFEVFHGILSGAPLIAQCPVNIECRLAHDLELPSNHLFIGEIVQVYAREDVQRDGRLLPERVDPIILTMPDNRYRKLGAPVGTAWRDGLGLRQKERDRDRPHPQ